MSYDPSTDFFALLRQTPGGVRTARVPGLDVAISALARAGFITLFVGQSPPTTNPTTTVWLKPAVPSWTAEGVVFLWDPELSAFAPATPFLWSELISGPFIALIPQPGEDAPLADGNASVGVAPTFSREDHRHPTDATRAPILSPTFQGEPQADTAPLGDDSRQLATTEFVIANGGLPPPIGCVLAYSGNVAPNQNWQLAQGQAVSRTVFANLFAIVGITYGSGDGVTTFNLPDMRGRTIAGVDAGANRLTTATMSTQALAGVGGAENHSLTGAENGPHAHGTTDPGHSHNSTITLQQNANVASNGVVGGTVSANAFSIPIAAAATGLTVSSNGSGTAHINVQPTMLQQYLIRVA